MTPVWIGLAVLGFIALSELARRLERTDLRIYLRSMERDRAMNFTQICPKCNKIHPYTDKCSG